jgi:hypothetical protein
MKLEKAITKSKLLSKFKELFPTDNKRIHVQPVRSIKHSLDYIRKEDGETIRFGELRQPMSWRKKIAIRIRQFAGDNSIQYLRDNKSARIQFVSKCNVLWCQQFPCIKEEWRDMLRHMEKYFPNYNFNFFINFLEKTENSK